MTSTTGFDALARDVVALVDRAGAQPAVAADAERWPQVRGAADRLRDRRFLIAVCGEFSSGKSTLLGALLGRPELFPADVGATTAVPTVVAWGPVERITVSTVDAPVGVVITAADLPRWVTQAGNPDNMRGVTEVRIALPAAQLEDGIAFVDLPGLGSTRAAHAVVTNDYLERVDAAVFVSAAQTVSETELTFLRRVTDRIGDALVIARSKADLVALQYGDDGVDRAIADVRAKAATALGVDAAGLVVVPVSATTFTAALGDEDEEAASNIPTLAVAIDTAITARAGSLLAGATLDGLDVVCGTVHEQLAVRLTALTEGYTTEIAALQDDLAARRTDLEKATLAEPKWTRDLGADLARIGDDEFHVLNGSLRRIRGDALAELDARTPEANAFTSRVINQVHDLYAATHRSLERRVNEVLADSAGKLGLELESVHAEASFRGTTASGFVEPVAPQRARTTVQRVTEASANAARKSGGWRILGTALGIGVGVLLAPATGGLSLVGAVAAGAAAGAAAGTVAATAVGLSEELDALDRVDPADRRRKLREHVVDALEPNQVEAADRLRRLTTALQDEASATLRTGLAAARADVATRIDDLSRDLHRSRDDARAEAGRLRPVVTELEAIAGESRALRARVAAARSRLSRWTANPSDRGASRDRDDPDRSDEPDDMGEAPDVGDGHDLGDGDPSEPADEDFD